jgi:hypothetical protein
VEVILPLFCLTARPWEQKRSVSLAIKFPPIYISPKNITESVPVLLDDISKVILWLNSTRRAKAGKTLWITHNPGMSGASFLNQWALIPEPPHPTIGTCRRSTLSVPRLAFLVLESPQRRAIIWRGYEIMKKSHRARYRSFISIVWCSILFPIFLILCGIPLFGLPGSGSGLKPCFDVTGSSGFINRSRRAWQFWSHVPAIRLAWERDMAIYRQVSRR